MCSLNPAEKRLMRELEGLVQEPPSGITIDREAVMKNLMCWIVELQGAVGTLYENEKFILRFRFSYRYPFDVPEVMFIGDNIPLHPHIYSNGHICLSILGSGHWSPALSVQAVCLSIISMLSSCKEKKRPPDNSLYVMTNSNKSPKESSWFFHDILQKIVDAFNLPENRNRFQNIKEANNNDMLKTMQETFPLAAEIESQVLQLYGFPSGSEESSP